jgi:hypothetical protein
MNLAQAAEFEGISLLWSQGMAHATHLCRKLKMGEVDFYPELNTLHATVS